MESLAASLRGADHEVAIALNTAEAVSAARAAIPDVVLVNVARADGYATARELHDLSAWRRPLLIAVAPPASGSANATGIDLHLVAPVDVALLHGLLGRIRTTLREIETFDPRI